MKFYAGVTDNNWFNFLKALHPDDANFWQPGGTLPLRQLLPGAPFLFKLKGKPNVVGGLGFFSAHSLLPISMAWEIFREKNGTGSFGTFYAKIDSLRSRGPGNSLAVNPVIGCCVLTNPVFFDVSDRIEIPAWKSNIVQGRYFDTSETDGERIWQAVEATLEKYLVSHQNEGLKNQLILEEPNSVYSKKILVNVRMGQSAFRVLVTDAYNRKCSISGEKTLPVLEAAHIKPYATSGPSYISNGILLRSDLHKLFDSGYITITAEYKVEVSNKIREEFENGREYYRFHGQPLSTLPNKQDYEPRKPYIEWHNLNVFKA